jgi:REP element-mobilizing transposase RayT
MCLSRPTQRGNARQFILACDADRSVYLDLLQQSIALHGVEVIGYCLMSDHVHLVVHRRAGSHGYIQSQDEDRRSAENL